jgi:hypothetical protein
MKKMFIVAHSTYSSHRICTEDLSKMYYFHKKPSPPLPRYSNFSDNEKAADDSASSETME